MAVTRLRQRCADAATLSREVWMLLATCRECARRRRHADTPMRHADCAYAAAMSCAFNNMRKDIDSRGRAPPCFVSGLLSPADVAMP